MTEFTRRARVLVVDDDEGIRDLLAAVLEPAGCAVEKAVDGREALDRLACGEWDAVLLDVNLPGMGGFEVLAGIRRLRSIEELPVIMVTGQDDADTRSEARRQHATEFLAKPIHPAELLARLGTVLSMHWARRDAERHLLELRQVQSLQELLVNCCIHDLRGPLTSAKGCVELAMDKLDDPDGPAARQLSRALAAIDRTVAMASDAIDVSRMEEGKLTPRVAPVESGALARACIESFAGLAESRSVDLRAEPERGLPRARADARLLGRILDNLTLNAIKHTPPGGRVRLAVRRTPDGGIAFVVSDTGEGIPPGYLERIFDKFAQVEVRSLGFVHDSGLGLTFCRLAAEVMGGSIRVDSEPGRGATFTVVLPAAAPEEAGAPNAELAVQA